MSADELRVLAEEQAALRRVATLVARGTPPEVVFAAVLEEVGQMLPVDFATMARYEPDDTAIYVASWGTALPRFPVGSRWSLDGKNLVTEVLETCHSARLDDHADASGPVGVAARESGFRSAVATPIVVERRLWGLVVAGSRGEEPLPADSEARLADFTELLATAIANSESRAGLARLAEEQAALRRVATLVARGALPEELFAAVVEEVGRLFGVDIAGMGRYEPDRTVTFVAAWGRALEHFAVGTRRSLGGKNLSTLVFESGLPARLDNYLDAAGEIGVADRETGVRSSVATPIIVEGRLWGNMAIGSIREPPLPANTEARLSSFTKLVATAIANAESRAGLARLAEEQAALRRVATLVARGAPPEEVFASVTEEVGQLLPVDHAGMARYESDGSMTIVASWGLTADSVPVGSRWLLEGKNPPTLVFETGRPVRVDSFADVSDPIADIVREKGVRSGVGAPIVVEGRLWGMMAAGSTLERPLPADTEARLADFTELLATAIANAEGRADLAASRARVVAAADDTRRRIERDLHDGTQQALVSLILELDTARATEPREVGELRAQLARTSRGLGVVLEELQELSRGIHPAILSRGGLERALTTLARRSAVPIELAVRAQRRLPEHVEVAAYYVVSEALTNAAKHARASVVNVELDARDASVRLAIRDDGIGGADPRQGSGLIGLRDRVDALGGTLHVTSPPGNGTTLLVEIPVEDHASAVPEP